MTVERISAAGMMSVHNRVGRNAKARLTWALNFAQRALDGLTASEWTNLRREMLVFSRYRITSEAVEWSGVQDMLRRGGHTTRSSPVAADLPSEHALREAHAGYRRIVTDLVSQGHVLVGPLEVRYWVVRGYTKRRDATHPPVADLSVETTGGVVGLESLVHLLGAYAHLVQVCPEPKCQRWFVADRTNQQFCSRRCQSRHTTRIKRDRDQRELEERRRAARRRTRGTAKARKAKHGSPAKRRVTRKPPPRSRRRS